MLHVARQAAEALGGRGISVEVIDARWLAPFDYQTVGGSVRRTRCLAVLHEATRTGGFAAEIITSVLEQGYPVSHVPLRITAPDVRIPAAPSLLSAVRPSVEQVVHELTHYVEGLR
jgi:pyruvate dehydrogenase E1 component beta subunit